MQLSRFWDKKNLIPNTNALFFHFFQCYPLHTAWPVNDVTLLFFQCLKLSKFSPYFTGPVGGVHNDPFPS